MQVKVFDPMDERAVKAWLEEGPRKEIIAGSIYVTRVDGAEHEVGIVLYVEEHTVGRTVPVSPNRQAESPDGAQ